MLNDFLSLGAYAVWMKNQKQTFPKSDSMREDYVDPVHAGHRAHEDITHAARLEGKVKNAGIKNTKKPKKKN